jgi:hypothetical protein
VKVSVEGQSLTAEDQLSVLMQAGMYLTTFRGMGAPEARLCYERAESLCHSLDRPMTLYSALRGQYLCFLQTDRLTTARQMSQRVYSVAQGQNNVTMMAGAYVTLAGPLYFMGQFEIARQYARRGVQLWRGSTPSQVEEVGASEVHLNPRTDICLCLEALCEWHLGEIDLAKKNVAEAISLRKSWMTRTH